MMEKDDSSIKKQQIAVRLTAVLKDLKRIRSQVSLVDARNHVRSIDFSINEIKKVKKELLRDA